MSATEDIPAVVADEAEYAIVEIMGHRRHFGRIADVERFGGRFLRIDVPMAGGFDTGWISHFYGGAAIFSITSTDRETVEAHNRPYAAPGRFLPPAQAEGEGDTTSDEGEF
ncbi:hypothetical protein [Zavarzinia sp.]|uniref:hypothetical protein n=1 Tax=Zavarzinia sp. TaxID=2027920 RepID=UPI003BB7E751